MLNKAISTCSYIRVEPVEDISDISRYIGVSDISLCIHAVPKLSLQPLLVYLWCISGLLVYICFSGVSDLSLSWHIRLEP